MKRRIALVNVTSLTFGGQETHVLNLCRELSERGRRAILVVLAGSAIHRMVREEGLACCAIPYLPIPGFFRLLDVALTVVLGWLCMRHGVGIIHCNNRFEVGSARRIARIFEAKVILNYHVTGEVDISSVGGVDAFVAVSPQVADAVQKRNLRDSLGIGEIASIPPLIDSRRFCGFVPRLDRTAWFAETFGISTENLPVISVIGNMVEDLKHKNYPLLFEAVALLVHTRKTPVKAVLVGDGLARPYLEALARRLEIDNYVHFVGLTTEHIPAVLHYSDVFVLASSREAFGIVFVEAALMQRPSIGARGTGAEHMIVDGETGVLFDNGSAVSLADAIQDFVSNPERARECGNRGFDHVREHFTSDTVMPMYEGLYERLSERDRVPPVVEPASASDSAMGEADRRHGQRHR